AKILVVGAGATGNEVIKNLALLGVGNILICDMDRIDTSNLSRTVLFSKDDVGKKKAKTAAERAAEMSVDPEFRVDYFDGDIVYGLGDGVFRQFDVVIGCLDNLNTRLSVNKRCCLLQKPYVDAGISELACSLNVFHYPYSSCYACGVSSRDVAEERRIRYSCDVFKKRAMEEEKVPTVLISSAIVGALAVQEAIKILHKDVLETEVCFGRRYFFQGINNNFIDMLVPKKEECLYHNSYENIIETEFTNKVKLRDFLEYVKEKNGEEYTLEVGSELKFVISANCRSCNKEIKFYKPAHSIYEEDVYCDECQKAGRTTNGYTDYKYILDFCSDMEEKDILDMTLEEIGIPKLHILSMRNKDDKYIFYELSGDIKNVMPNIS
ncbi:MAG: ThiF family adenylyltransferase, partial [Firmicutes bacterium]|nr:ThiF family adenylyltransferase [Bacillota bacterium]